MKVLTVRFSSIGDCVMAAHSVSALRRWHPDSEIVWAIDPRCRPVIAQNRIHDQKPGQPTTLVDEFYEIPWERWKESRVGSLTRIRHYLKLRSYRFDVGIDLQGHAKTAICLRLAGCRRTIAVRALDPLVKVLIPLASYDEGLHWVEEQFASLQQVIFDLKGPLTPVIMPAVDILPKTDKRPLVTISVGSGHPKKNYARLGEVAAPLLSQGLRIAWLGTRPEVAPKATGSEDLVGKQTLSEAASWIASSAVHIAADTGSGHIAAAYNVPVVSIFGWTDPVKCSPYTTKKTVLDAGPRMDQLPPMRVVEAVQRWL